MVGNRPRLPGFGFIPRHYSYDLQIMKLAEEKNCQRYLRIKVSKTSYSMSTILLASLRRSSHVESLQGLY